MDGGREKRGSGGEEKKKKEKRKTHHNRCGERKEKEKWKSSKKEKRRINNPPSSSISVLVFLDGLSTTLSFFHLPENTSFPERHTATIQSQLLKMSVTGTIVKI